MSNIISASKDTRDITQNSRSLILDVALRLFTQKGYDGTSIDDIRQAAGFKSKASLYTHFKSKEEVAIALLTRVLSDEEGVVMEAYQTAAPQPLARFLAMGRAFIEWGLTHPQEYAFCFLRVQQEMLMRGQYGYLDDRPSASYPVLLDQIQEMRGTYPVRSITDAALLSMVVGLVSKAVVDQLAFGPISLAEKVQQIIEMCFGVLFAESVAIPERS